MKILIVEDDSSILNLLNLMASSLGHEVISVDNAEAFKKVFDSSFDLLITDYRLGVKTNGRILADWAKTKKPEMKVIFISGNLEDLDIKESEYGLKKPFSLSDLKEVIEII